MRTYQPPLDKLLTLGEPNDTNWPDYPAMGFTQEHIPGLIGLANDVLLRDDESESPEGWGPVHAWRALGQLKAKEALLPLLENLGKLIGNIMDGIDEWAFDELPIVFAMIHPEDISPFTRILTDRRFSNNERFVIINALQKMIEQSPQTTSHCKEVLLEELKHFEENDDEFNGYLISILVDAKVKEALPWIERAFEADMVDPSFCGDLDDILIDFGLKEPTKDSEEDLNGWEEEEDWEDDDWLEQFLDEQEVLAHKDEEWINTASFLCHLLEEFLEDRNALLDDLSPALLEEFLFEYFPVQATADEETIQALPEVFQTYFQWLSSKGILHKQSLQRMEKLLAEKKEAFFTRIRQRD